MEGLWKQQLQDPTKKGIDKLLRALEDTRSCLRRIGVEKARERREKEDSLRKALATLQHKAEQQHGRSPDDDQQWERVTRELQELENNRARGWQVRARVKWAAEGDTPSKYFFHTLKKKQAKNEVPLFKKDDGSSCETQDDWVT